MTGSIIFTIPDSEWISANDRMHWAAKARRTAALSERARIQSLNAMRSGQLPACFGRVRVIAGIQYRAGRADPANAYPTVKALIDGMTRAGVWEDDDSAHLLGPDMRRVPGRPPQQTHTIAIAIEEVGDAS